MRLRLASCLAVLLAAPFISRPMMAQDQPKDDVTQQLAALREAVIQQTRQIDLLTAEVARMNRIIGGKKVPSEPAPNVMTPAPNETAPVVMSAATPLPATAVVPAPPAASTGPEHIVAKGEYLAIIAKKYNTTAEELEKLNHITDARKIQIGQVLKLPPNTVIPTPAPPKP